MAKTYPTTIFSDPIPDGTKIANLTVYYGGYSIGPGTSAHIGGFGYCYSAVSNGQYDSSHSGCFRHPCTQGTESSICVKSTVFRFAANEEATSLSISWYPTNWCPVSFTINTATNQYNVGGTNLKGVDYNYQVPAGSRFAGLWTTSYQCPTREAFYIQASAVCGDGIVQSGEQCDNPSSVCCTSTCQFASATTVCRSSQGLCDVAESCTGSSDVCPSDQVLPAGTPCGETFGMCDVVLQQTCNGTSPQCYPTPSLPASVGSVQPWSTFNVLSFGSYNNNGGVVEGRLAARNDVTLDSFTLGRNLPANDFWSYSLVAGGNLAWSSGSLLPDGSSNGLIATALVGGNVTAPDYLASRLSTNSIGRPNVKASFDAAENYFNGIQVELSTLPVNAQAQVQYGNGLFITCSDFTSLVYHVKVDAITFNSVYWYSTVNCSFSARWVIDITGSDDVTFQGAPFPGIVERVIYNILGSGRTVSANNGVNGHLLAPGNTYSQTQGVTYGNLVVGNVAASRQNALPQCTKFNPVVITVKLMTPVTLGDTIIYVADLSNLVKGDQICINGNCADVVKGVYVADGDGWRGAVTVASAPFSAGVYSLATVTVINVEEDRSVPLAIRPTSNLIESNPSTDFDWNTSSASVLAVSITTLFVSLF
eukprot:TRINITY_DN267_c0_g3_i1.p1 TRINITY_DN267_c0_g3~~TRINITY_DN267_c0_g3_i1.p1  ORF type:complete len:694 (-),score=174.65 TRINITY_DN267_c0_g3_i1:43-1989(-)